jgi:hypothetical protein
MRGARAKLLRHQAELMTINRPARQLEVVKLPPRTKWVDVPDDGKTFLERLRNKFLRSLGLPTKMRRERRMITPTIVREKKGTTRWAYRRLKQMFYRIRHA